MGYWAAKEGRPFYVHEKAGPDGRLVMCAGVIILLRSINHRTDIPCQ